MQAWPGSALAPPRLTGPNCRGQLHGSTSRQLTHRPLPAEATCQTPCITAACGVFELITVLGPCTQAVMRTRVPSGFEVLSSQHANRAAGKVGQPACHAGWAEQPPHAAWFSRPCQWARARPLTPCQTQRPRSQPTEGGAGTWLQALWASCNTASAAHRA